jgi:hypothetical protein
MPGPVHFHQGATGTASSLFALRSINLTAAPAAASCTTGSASALPRHVVEDPRSLVAHRNLFCVQRSAINQEPGRGVEHRRKRTKADPAAAVAPAPKAAKSSQIYAGCPHCSDVKRGNATHRTTRARELWKTDPNKPTPSRVFDAEIGNVPNLRGAWRRKYTGLPKAASLDVCTKYGCKELV